MNKNSVCRYVGEKYNKLTILSIIKGDSRKRKVIAICECGVEKEFWLWHIIRGNSKSCGCLCAETIKRIRTTHGLTAHPLYSVWTDMKTRCLNKKHPSYKGYGAKGVKICAEWISDFKSFYEWSILNGWKPGLEIDKDTIGNGKMYSPSTCCYLSQIDNLNAIERKKGIKITQFYTSTGEHKCSKPIICVNTGVRYNSITEAAKKLNIIACSIGQVCAGKRNSVFGMKFIFSQ